MSLETVVDDIKQDAKERAETLREEGEREADQIITEANEEAEQIRDDAEAEVETQIEQEREQTESSARLEAKQEQLRAKREALEALYTDLEDELAALDSDRRRDLTVQLLEAGLAELGDVTTVYVHGRPDDEQLLKELIADRDDIAYGGTTECLGGVVLTGPNDRIRINNTFDSILEDVWEAHRKEISSLLFEE